MSFIAIDLILLAVFTIVTVVFLYTHKKNIARQGILILYKTKIGIEIIDYTAKKYKRFLSFLEYIIIFCGYILMISIIWIIAKFSYYYVTTAGLARALRIPVLMPLVPYIDKVFPTGILPPFYFTYWIIIIAIVAIPHEFFHGIFAKLSNIKVHSTGFGFLGPLIAFFVEPDEKTMNKSKIKSQMAILASGTFANVLVTILSALLMFIFFSLAFVPSGVIFNSYAVSPLNNTGISVISNVSFGNTTYLEISSANKTYITTTTITPFLNNESIPLIPIYVSSPAFDSQMKGAISKINNIPIRSYKDLNRTLNSYSPGDKVTVQTITKDETHTYELILGNYNGRALLGIGFSAPVRDGMLGKLYLLVDKVKRPEVYYYSKLGDFGVFVNDLLWWLVLINISVALMNMLPAGIFDGGRFFYLTVLTITKKKKVADIAFKIATWILLLLLVVLMIKWAFAFL
jgi:membrane-associated protease RseP (regulator of RpoE activity)